MVHLLRKELRLTMHPASLIFLSLSALLLIPHYPYLVTFFYTGLSVFFTCMNAREFHDLPYVISLPVAKRDIVKARFGLVLFLQGAQVLLAIPFAMLRGLVYSGGNQVGMDANIAFFGIAFLLLGLFNITFLPMYYRNPQKVGWPFVASSIVVFLYIVLAETATHIIPFFRDRLDTPDPLFLAEKFMVLCCGIAFYLLLTLWAYQRSAARFEKLDL